MIIFGIDPGSRVTGFGLVQIFDNQILHVSHGVIKMEPELDFNQRLFELSESLEQLLVKYQPDIVVIEKIFLGKNADSAFKLGHVRGVAIQKAVAHRCVVKEYASRLIKKAITGSGQAEKQQVLVVIQKILGLNLIQHLDASDALALAVYQASQQQRPSQQGIVL